MKTYYALNGKIINRKEFEELVVDYIYTHKLFALGNLLPHLTVRENVERRPYRIAREIGLNVSTLKG